ncbi:CYTH domain-containing protein [uncultured Flavobacterium sp.]|uniref:CYTH domain-containing protein n=1 Tax=uncultured Flavobacterium sp. TaxID=165435 RepID=UPI0030CA510E|tara:strand:- start:1294 stop:1761 length:468 start_codon:yes stop_codon:yes gene_type:complete
MIEIERKFLVNSDAFLNQSKRQNEIIQGYLSSVAERTVRVRIRAGKGYITVKGIGNESGLSRMEWEKEIDLHEAKQLLLLCEKGVIAKTRYEIAYGNHVFEVDVFEGNNKGLTIAEVELDSETEYFEKPNWLGEEVTGDVRYYNSYLSKTPYMEW